MLDQLRDLSTLPPAGLSKLRAEHISLLFKAVSGSAVVLAFLLFFFLPSAQPSVTKVSTTLLGGGYQCSMIARGPQIALDFTTLNISVPLAPGAAPFSTLFHSWDTYTNGNNPYPTPNSGANPLSPLCTFCDADNGVCLTSASGSNLGSFTSPGILFDTYESCLADYNIQCKVADTQVLSGGLHFLVPRVACTIGSKGVAVQLSFTAALSTATSSLPSCYSANTVVSTAATGWLPNQDKALVMSFFPSSAVTAAFATVFTPAAVCAPFAPNKNPPYLCTGTERQSLISIILQSLALYGTSIGILTAAVPVALMLLNLRTQKGQPGTSRRTRRALRRCGSSGSQAAVVETTVPAVAV